MRSCIHFASPEVVHRPRLLNSYGKNEFKFSAQRLLLAALLERWPHVCRVNFEDYVHITTDELFYFHKTNSMKYIVN